MSVSLLEVIEAAGYDLNTIEDAEWLKSKDKEWNELLEKAGLLIDLEEERLSAIAEDEYQERFVNE